MSKPIRLTKDLTVTQKHIVSLVALGLTDIDIQNKLKISRSTFSAHINNIRNAMASDDPLNLAQKLDIVALAVQEGLIMNESVIAKAIEYRVSETSAS